jgi:exopolysaccharide production protein ExoQ
MSVLAATVVCSIGIAGLFYLNRDPSIRPSMALWLPTLWLAILGSRPISVWFNIWFGITSVWNGESLQDQLDGSPLDAAVYGLLVLAGIAVLVTRATRAGALLRINLPILLFFAYSLLSVVWSPYPEVAWKRWFKGVGDLVMVLILATEPDPVGSLRRLFSRLGFVLMPFSIMLIHYSPLGRSYDVDGGVMNTGVTTNKNMLGAITFILAMGALWNFIHVYRARRNPARTRRLVAQGTVLLFSIATLSMAHSSTSLASFLFGSMMLLLTQHPVIRTRPAAVHTVVFTVVLLGGLMVLFGGEAAVVHALGRQTNLTGRTDIWDSVILACPNPIFGAGYESFWISPSAQVAHQYLRPFLIDAERINEAHNGYLEVYINLGFVGLFLILWILIGGYRKAVASFRRNPEVGTLMLAYVVSVALYAITEAGFRELSPIWISLLLAVVIAGGTNSGIIRVRKPRTEGAAAGRRRVYA